MRSWFHKVLLTERGYQLAYWAPTAPYAQCLGLCYNLNEQIFASIMHGCPELSKGALGQNVHLQELELSKICMHGFIEYCLLKGDTNSHIGPLQLPMLNVWVCVINWTNKFSHRLCMVPLSSVKALWGKMLSYRTRACTSKNFSWFHRVLLTEWGYQLACLCYNVCSEKKIPRAVVYYYWPWHLFFWYRL